MHNLRGAPDLNHDYAAHRPMKSSTALLILVLLSCGTLATPALGQDCFDEYEPNDGFGQALGLIFDWPAHSIVCNVSDADYFSVTLTVGQRISARLANNPHPATIEVFAPNQQPVGQAVSNAGFADVPYTATSAGTHYVRISGTDGQSQNPYEVTVLDQGGGPTPLPTPTPTPTPTYPGCPDGFEPNDVVGGPGWAINGGPLVSYICAAADVDYFRITGVQLGQTIQVDLTGMPKDYDLTLYRPNLSQAHHSDNPGQADEQIRFTADAGGDWHARITGKGQFDATQPYAVDASLSNCSLDAHEPNDHADQAASVGHPTTPQVVANLNLCPAGDEDWFSLDLSTFERVIADIVHDPSQGPVRMCLVDPDKSTTWTCTPGILRSERIDYIVQTSGRFYLQTLAQSQGGTNPSYTITAAIQAAPPTPTPCPADTGEPNDSALTSTLTGVCPQQGCSDTFARTTLSICSGDEDWFEASLDAGDALEASIDFVHANGDLDLEFYDGTSPGPIVQANSGTDDEYAFFRATADGTPIAIRVFSKAPGASNLTYDIAITRTPPTPLPTPSPTPIPTPTPTPIVCPPGDTKLDLSLEEMEITQSIQDLNHSVPLVGSKTTYARIFVKSDRNIFLPSRATAFLRAVKFDGTPLSPSTTSCYGYLRNIKRRGTSLSYERSQTPRIGLSCRLPRSWVQPNAAPILITGHVDTPTGFCDPNGSNDETSVYADFEARIPVFAQVVQVREGCSHSGCGPAWADYKNLHLLAERMWPTSSIRLIPPKGGWVSWSGDEGTLPDIRTKYADYASNSSPKLPGQFRFNTVIAAMRNPYAGVGPRGFATGGGFWVTTDRPVTFAHEFGHAAGGLEHVKGCMSGNGNGNGGIEPYPYATDKLSSGHPRGFWGLDTGFTYNFPGVIDPNVYADTLTYCSPRWASDYTYTKFARGQLSTYPRAASASAGGAYVRLSGTIDSVTDEVVASPLRFTDTPSGEVGDDFFENIYSAALLDGAGNILSEQPFTPSVIYDSPTTRAAFGVHLPVNPAMATVAVYRGELEIFSRTASPNPPRIVVDPISGTVDDLLTIDWTTDDDDGEPLFVSIEWSADGGELWQPLGLDLSDSTAELDTSFWAGTSQGLLRFHVSDGFHQTSQVVGPFSVRAKDPVVYILTPGSGVEMQLGEPLSLRASAFDAEEQFFDDDSFSWFSDVDGALGTGEELHLQDLTPGWHELTVEVTDADAHTGSDSVHVCASDLLCDGSPSECPVAGFAPDADEDGVCDRIDLCPDDFDPGQADTDRDGSGDACDPCIEGAALLRANLRLSDVSHDDGDDVLRYNATLEFETPPELVPLESGLALSIFDAGGTPIVELSLPPGERSPDFGGWFQNREGTRHRFTSGPASDGPKVRATVRLHRHRPNIVKISVHASHAAFASPDIDLPLRANLTFTPPAGITGQCAETAFGDELEGCRLSRDGRRVVCG